MMRQCARLSCGGQIVADEDGRRVCLLCGTATFEPEPTLVEKLISNSTNYGMPGVANLGPRQEPTEAPSAVYERIMASVRKEAAHGHR